MYYTELDARKLYEQAQRKYCEEIEEYYDFEIEKLLEFYEIRRETYSYLKNTNEVEYYLDEIQSEDRLSENGAAWLKMFLTYMTFIKDDEFVFAKVREGLALYAKPIELPTFWDFWQKLENKAIREGMEELENGKE